MVDINRHRFLMVQILKDIYSDIELANCLGFKGGTALMFFHELPRFSLDLDFNLLDVEKEDVVYRKIRSILLKHGKIHDEAKKYYGPLIVLDYGVNQRKLKVEITNRAFENHYEIRNLLGIDMKVMIPADMFAHKLCALLDRSAIANRDIFDCWFFMHKRTPVNNAIIEARMGVTYEEYLQRCIDFLESMPDKGLLQGLGELMDEKMRKFVRKEMRTEAIALLRIYKEYPILSEK